MSAAQWILNIDRRIVYVIVALCVAVPLIKPLQLPIVPTPEVKGVYDEIDKLQAGDNILISADFDPSSKPELLPILEGMLAHCFIRGVKPHLLTLWPSGPGLVQMAVEKQAAIYKKQSGTDYVFLGYRAGQLAVILGMASSIPSTFVTDFYGKTTANMPIYQDITKISQMKYIVDLAAGATVEVWIAYASEPQKVLMGAACTAVSAAQYAPYLQAHQITGLAVGMKGAAEYEKLLVDEYGGSNGVKPGDATKGMDAQSAVHVFIVLAIIIANIALAAVARQERNERRAA